MSVNRGKLKSHATLATVFSALAMLLTAAQGENIVLEGFVPPGISRATVSYEFRRLNRQLSPRRDLGTEPLTVTYFTKEGVGTADYSLPEWGGGGALGTGRIVVALDGEPFFHRDFLRTTVHELVHIAVNRICTTTVVPRWFHEGLAMTLSGDVTQGEQVVISQAILTGNLLELSSIDSVNAFGRFRARLAYAQSHQAVLFLVDSYGIEVLQEILEEANRAGDFWQGVRHTLQLSENEIESMLRSYLIRKFRMAFFFSDTYLLWLGATMLFVVGYILTRIRNARKAAQMDLDEKAGEDPGA